MKGARAIMLSDRGHRPYAAADLSDPNATLMVRDTDRGERRDIPRNRWRFAREEADTVVADSGYIYLEQGFEAGKLYEVVYTAEGAPVVGLGLLSTRDAVSFVRYAPVTAGNPCAGNIDLAYGFGASGSGRFLRHFLHLALNEDEDEDERLVFDGVIIY